MSRPATTRAQAEHDIEQLYGWPEEYGDIDGASDTLVIAVAQEQFDHDATSGGRGLAYRTSSRLDALAGLS